MPSLSSSSSGAQTIPYVNHWCETKQNWTDDWQFAQYVECLNFKRSCAPDPPVAHFRYQTGQVKQQDQTSFSEFDSQDLRDWFIRVWLQPPNDDPYVAWTGVVAEEELTYQREDIDSGPEMLTAYGLESILDRYVIGSSYAEDDSDDGSDDSIDEDEDEDTQDIIELDWAVPFNRRPKKGFQLKGNRSIDTIPDDGSNDSVYTFSSDGQIWSHTDIVNYLLWFFTPDDMTFNLNGQIDSLNTTQDYFDLKKMTTWKALCHLIDRKRGVGFYLDVQDDDTININVFTLTDFDIQVGSKTLPANDNQINLTFPSDPPFNHLVDDVPFTTSTHNLYSQIIVRGARIKMVAPFGYQQAPLINGWTEDAQNDYLNATNSTDQSDPDANDKYRSREELFGDVFRSYWVDPEWDGTDENGDNMLPIPQDDGSVSLDTDDGDPVWWGFQKTFSRTLPFKRMVDYSQSPPTDARPDTAVAEFQPMLVLYFDEDDGDSHTADQQWHQLDLLNFTNDELPNLASHPLNNQLGFRVSHTPNHYFALNHFNDNSSDPNMNANPTNHEPEIDFENMMVVAMAETDARARIVLNNPNVFVDRPLHLDINSARYIYAVPDCPIGVMDDGTDLKTIDDDERVLIDDTDVLQTIACELAGWFSSPRQAIQITAKQPGYYADLGAFLVSLSGINSQTQVGTVITSLDTDLVRQRTTLRTSYLELDYVKLLGRAEDVDSEDD